MLVRKCDLETSRDLTTKDKEKLLAIVMLDSIEEPELIHKALEIIERLSRQQRRS